MDVYSIPSLLQAKARQAPGDVALRTPGRADLSYEGLWRHLSGVVQTLNKLGIGRGDRLAVVLPNGPEMAAAFLGVASTAICAPLNPSYRENEFDFYLGDLAAAALILQSGDASPARAAAQKRDIPIIELTPLAACEAGLFALRGEPRPCSAVKHGPADASAVALVLHTSGTTARPKRVPLTHANLCASAQNTRTSLRLEPTDRCLSVMPLFHIHGLVGALLASLAAGASVVCTPGFHAPTFFEWLKTERPTWYTAAPTMHQAILSQAAGLCEVSDRCRLRFVRSGSAALAPAVFAELEAVFGCPVIESYGMTEASHQMASNPLPPAQRKPGSVGVPAGPEITVLDETGQMLPANTPGEVAIRGANVMTGYADNPVANARAFTNGWFRTGDQGYFDADGYLFLTGRIKEMINRGGEKIAPREVDEVLLSHAAVAQAVTFAIPHPRLGEDVGAVVVLRPDAFASESSLRGFALDRLAASKVPSQVMVVDQIPTGATGKLQRIGLYEKLAHLLRPPYVAPAGPVEEAVANVWREVLEVDRVSAADNFFFLGGDSLLATQVAVRLNSAFEVELPLEMIFRAPTVAGQALAVEELILAAVEQLPEPR